jgi:hypothetical protein
MEIWSLLKMGQKKQIHESKQVDEYEFLQNLVMKVNIRTLLEAILIGARIPLSH